MPHHEDGALCWLPRAHPRDEVGASFPNREHVRLDAGAVVEYGLEIERARKLVPWRVLGVDPDQRLQMCQGPRRGCRPVEALRRRGDQRPRACRCLQDGGACAECRCKGEAQNDEEQQSNHPGPRTHGGEFVALDTSSTVSDNPRRFQRELEVHAPDELRTMCDNHPSHVELSNLFVDLGLQSRIQVRRPLVEEQYARLSIERAGEQHALTLSSGQHAPHVADLAVVLPVRLRARHPL